jgi:hypothetical protein
MTLEENAPPAAAPEPIPAGPPTPAPAQPAPTAPEPAPAPAPAPAVDPAAGQACGECNNGVISFGTDDVTCAACGGTGKKP